MANSKVDERIDPGESQHSAIWLVKNFSKTLNAPVSTKIVSPPFAVGKFVFEFWLYPGGSTVDADGYVSVLLKLCEPAVATINFSVEMGYESVKFYHSTKCEHAFESEQSKPAWGDDKLVERDILLDEVLKLSNDEVMIKCTVYGLDTPESCNRLKLLEKNEQFFNSEKLSDIKIIMGNKSINAHKITLMNGSDVFAAMLEHHMVENDQGVINIDDIDHDVMLEVVRFMYTGRVQKIHNKTKELLIAADKYALTELITLCGKYLSLNLTPDNVLELANFAHTYHVNELKQAAISYFTLHGKEVVETSNFSESLTLMDVDVMVELMKKLV